MGYFDDKAIPNGSKTDIWSLVRFLYFDKACSLVVFLGTFCMRRKRINPFMTFDRNLKSVIEETLEQIEILMMMILNSDDQRA